MKVSVIGQGYVGLPLALALASSGHIVSGIDSDLSLVEKVGTGLSPTTHISDGDIQNALESGKYGVSASYESIRESEVVIICVPTPLDQSHQPDFSFLIAATTWIAKFLQKGTLVINESTVSPGSTRGLIKGILDEVGVDYDLAYSPERIDPANKKWNVSNTPKLVAGLTSKAAERAASFYRTFVESVSVGSSLEVIETAKLLENSFRLINISFINEIAQFCTALKIDAREVIDAAATKPFGFLPFYPSAGVGGHCIPVDPSYLALKAREVGAPTRFIDLANELNHSLASYFAGIATKILGDLKNKKLLVVGIAYKPDVSDLREAPGIRLINELRLKGAEVSWHDDLVKNWNGEISVPLSTSYDLVILVNPHSGTDFSALGSSKILNTRGGHQ